MLITMSVQRSLQYDVMLKTMTVQRSPQDDVILITIQYSAVHKMT